MKFVCPMCKTSCLEFERNPFFPFCSKICKKLDLDNWMAEKYNISSPLTDEDQKEEDDI